MTQGSRIKPAAPIHWKMEVLSGIINSRDNPEERKAA